LMMVCETYEQSDAEISLDKRLQSMVIFFEFQACSIFTILAPK